MLLSKSIAFPRPSAQHGYADGQYISPSPCRAICKRVFSSRTASELSGSGPETPDRSVAASGIDAQWNDAALSP